MRDSGAGILVSFDAQSIADGIGQICADQKRLKDWKSHAESFSNTHLKYSNYVPEFKAIVGGTQGRDAGNQSLMDDSSPEP